MEYILLLSPYYLLSYWKKKSFIENIKKSLEFNQPCILNKLKELICGH